MDETKNKRESNFYADICGGMLTYNLTIAELIIYATIHGFSQGSQICNSSLTQFEHITGACRHKVIGALKSLEEKELIKIIKAKNTHQNNAYYSCISRTTEDFPEPGRKRIKKTDNIQVKGWMREYGLKPNELVILALIERHSYDGRSTYKASLAEMQEWLGVKKPDTVIKAIKNLVEKNLIVKAEVRQGKTNSYYTVHSREAKTTPQNAPATKENAPPTTPRNALATTPQNAPTAPQNALATTPQNALSNTVTNNSNNTTTNNSKETKKTATLPKSAEALFPTIENNFGFMPDFSADLYEALETIPENLREEYITFEFNREKGKAKNQVCYFYSEAKRQSNIQNFLNFKRQQKERSEKIEKQNIECPVCATKFNKYAPVCKNCGFETKDFKNIKLVDLNKKLWILPKEKKDAYYGEIMAYRNDLSFIQKVAISETAEYKAGRKAWEEEVNRKFGLIA